MKLSDYKKDSYEFSSKASEVARAAAFAGIAVIWVFRISSAPVPTLPKELLLPVACFAAGLAIDLLQYVTGAMIWFSFYRYHERRLQSPHDDPVLTHSPWLSLPINVFILCEVNSDFGRILFRGHFSLPGMV
jgi:hypothetical protein